MLMALTLAGAGRVQAQSIWDGGANDFVWTNPVNWNLDVVPSVTADVTFGLGSPGFIHLAGDQTENSLVFNQNFTLGDYGTNLAVTNTSGNVSVGAGVFVTMDAAYAGPSMNLSGGGSLFLNNPFANFAGNISVSGPGTTLVFRADQPMPQYNGVNGSAEVGRGDTPSLGISSAVKTITLTNGGEFKYLGGGNNPEGGYKNLIIGTGGGAVNLAAGFTVWNLDDAGQIAAAAGNTFTKRGNGRLTITGSMADANPLAGDVVVDGGMFELSRLQAGSGTANTRYAGMTGTTSTPVGTNTLTLNNNAVLMLNNGTVGNLDVATLIANNGSVLGINSAPQEIGVRAGGNILNINGSVSLLHRDLYAPQSGRNFFINSDITGAGTLNILPSTQAGSSSRLVLQRASAASTFTGVFRLTENANLELNPRANAVVDVGKLLAGGDVEFAGWSNQLDLRDSDPAAANIKDYTDNELSITTGQAGNLNRITVGRATTAAGAGHMINFGTLTMGNHRLGIEGNNGYIVGLADTAAITGNALIEQRNAQLVFNNASALVEDAPGRTLTLFRNGAPNSGTFDVTSAGNLGISNLTIGFGVLDLRGANGAIGKGFGGAPTTVTINGGDTSAAGRGVGLQGLLNLDSSGTVLGVAAANNNNRVDDAATVRMLSNSILRLTSFNNGVTTETINTVNVAGGHALIDVVKTGTSTAPVGFTLNSVNLSNNSTVNFTGTSLGVAGVNTSRIVIPGTATGFIGSAYHSGDEWAKYSAASDSGMELGVTPFVAADYTINPLEGALAAGQQTKYNGAAGITLTANRNTDRLNLQFSAANQAVNTGGFVLSLNQGGLLVSTNVTGITGTAGVGGLTAGTTAPAQLYVHNTANLELMIPITDNLGADGVVGGGDDRSVDFVKSGTGTVILSHQ
ncbi:MAG: hypothetical protein JWL90_426, partial [Chthoniobacteraceae bacterium]|nr:hypothetical protein [Chthoniobacteraceae bacterium]